MALFDALIDDLASRFGLGANAGPLVREVLNYVNGSPGGLGHDPQRPIAQLAVLRLHVHHQISKHVPAPDKGSSAQHIEDQLGCRSGLHPSGPGHNLRPRQRLDRDIDGARELRFRRATDPNGCRPHPASLCDGA